MKSWFFVLGQGLLLVCYLGCASRSALTCQESDWYEIGRREGAMGAALDPSREFQVCSYSQEETNRLLYQNGRNAGLVSYCTPENAYQVGRSGESYHQVCPPHLEPEIGLNYQQGRRIYNLENQSFSIQQKMTQLEDRLRTTKDSARAQKIKGELEQLRKAQLQNQTDLSEVQAAKDL